MKKATDYAGVGLFFILGVGLLWIVFEYLNGGSIDKDKGYEARTTFSDVKQLKEGDDVRMAGVRVGSVKEVGLDGGSAYVVLLLDEQYQIPKNVTAKVLTAGLLGSNFISLDVPPQIEGYISGDTEIASKATADINSLLNKIDSIGEKVDTALSGMADLFSADKGPSALFSNVNQLVNDNKANIEKTLSNFANITDTLAEGKGTLGRLLQDEETYNSLQKLVGQIEGAAEKANLFLADMQDVTAKIKSGEGTLGKLMTSDEISNKIDETVGNFLLFSQNLNDKGGTIGKLLNDDEIYKDLQAVIKKAERTFNSVSDTGPISGVSVISNALF